MHCLPTCSDTDYAKGYGGINEGNGDVVCKKMPVYKLTTFLISEQATVERREQWMNEITFKAPLVLLNTLGCKLGLSGMLLWTSCFVPDESLLTDNLEE